MPLQEVDTAVEVFVENSDDPGTRIESVTDEAGTFLLNAFRRAQAMRAITLSDAGTLANALTRVTNEGRAILVLDTDELLGGADYTIPANCWVLGAGGKLTVSSATLDVQGQILSDQQIFAYADLDNAGTLKVATSTLDPRWFGADGTDGTDCQVALRSMQRCALSDNTKRWTFDFPKGSYTYTKNWWMKQIKHLTIRGNGSIFECISTDTLGRNYRVINNSVWLEDTGLEDSSTGSSLVNEGMLIDSAACGDRSVTVSTPAEMANISVGDWVMIAGYAQQDGGWPYNLRYAEFRQVRAVNGTSGLVSFGEGLRNAYNSAWPDFGPYSVLASSGLYWGKPRLYHCHWDGVNDDRPINEFQRWEDCRFKWNRNKAAAATHNFNVVGIIDCELHNCDFAVGQNDADDWVSLDCGAGRRLVATHCNIYNVEADKLLERLVIDNCACGRPHDAAVTRPIVGATGVTNLTIRDSDLGGNLEVSPRELYVENCKITIGPDGNDAINSFTGNYPTRAALVTNCQIASDDYQAHEVISFGGLENFTVDSVGAANQIKVANDAAGKDVLQLLEVGKRLYKSDMSITARVTDIYASGSDYVVENDASAAWNAGDTIEVRKLEPEQIWERANTHNGRPTRRQWVTTASHGLRWSFSAQEINWSTYTEYVYGRVVEIWVNVLTAYSGGSSNPYLRLHALQDGSGTEIGRVDLATVGARRFAAANPDIEATDSHTPANQNVLVDQIQFAFKTGGSSLPVVAGEMPDVNVAVLVL